MENNIVKAEKTVLGDLETFCQELLKTKKYREMGPVGIRCIIEMANSLGINPYMALNGDMYYFNGVIELRAFLMNRLIRSKGHHIEKLRHDNQSCVLRGTRADTNKQMITSFTWEDATCAGLTNRAVWRNYPSDMLFARALSRLARQLFPDAFGSQVYAEGEVSQGGDENLSTPVPLMHPQVAELERLYKESDPVRVENIQARLHELGYDTDYMSLDIYNASVDYLKRGLPEEIQKEMVL